MVALASQIPTPLLTASVWLMEQGGTICASLSLSLSGFFETGFLCVALDDLELTL